MEAKTPSNMPLSPATASFRSRRDSFNSLSTVSQADKEQLAQALDKIHTSASQSGVLTTFNDFAPPPATAPSEAKGSPSELVHQGISGLYSRIKEAVGVGKANTQDAEDTERHDAAHKRNKASLAPGLGLCTNIGVFSWIWAIGRQVSAYRNIEGAIYCND
ncbi:hypothetical protein VMCG_03514 [Cytospora schulzeri]|uniref:Uncharacterized protein n=1 Tax=Cytospora schulzeri TaxID=448051 RepID=A0A423WWE7_9PEZI|nr:hypothetical protein VMCG_03514 [Valsa malicola]